MAVRMTFNHARFLLSVCALLILNKQSAIVIL